MAAAKQLYPASAKPYSATERQLKGLSSPHKMNYGQSYRLFVVYCYV